MSEGLLGFREWHAAAVRHWGNPIPDQIEPDCVVIDTTLDDWQAVLEVVHAQEWRTEYTDASGRRAPLPHAAEALAFPGRPESHFGVWLATGVLLVFYLQDPDWIWFDFSLDDVADQGALNDLCNAVRSIGRAIKRTVELAYGDDVFCTYDNNTDTFTLT